MKEKIITSWRQDKLYMLLLVLWMATVLSSFFGSYLLPITIPVVGTIYAFRILLPITVLLYIIWAVRNGESLWRDISTLEKWCDILGIVLLIYGAVSLLRAVEFYWTFRRLFNLTYDIFFFWLTIRILHIPAAKKWTINICAVMLSVLIVLGLYEVFFGGIVDPAYDNYKRVFVFTKVLQFPVVFSGNTNDYSATLIFLFSAILLWWLQPGNILGRAKAIALAILGVLCYTMPLTANARLCEIAILILLIGVVLYLFISKKKGRFLIPAILIVGILFVEFSNRYYYLMPQINAYIQSIQEEPTDTGESNTTTSRPSIQLSSPFHESLQEQFFETNTDTGETQLRQDGSAGVRTRLLIHAGRCFVKSYGLGVGLGNTELMARDQHVITGEKQIWGIHCFVARIIADCGVFALIPLCAIAWLLLKNVVAKIVHGIRERNRVQIGYGVLFLCILLVYPFASTASADAQDLLSMWLYLGAIVSIGCVDTLTEGA